MRTREPKHCRKGDKKSSTPPNSEASTVNRLPFPGKQPVTLPGFTRDGAVVPGGAALRPEARLRRRQEEQELQQPEPWSFPCPWQRLV